MNCAFFGCDPALLWARLGLFSAFALPITVIDARTRRIPDALSLGAAAALTAFDAILFPRELGACLGAGCLLPAVFQATRLATGALGGGDVKYSSSIGLFLGLPWCFAAIFLSALAAIAFGLCAGRRAPGGASSARKSGRTEARRDASRRDVSRRNLLRSHGREIPFAPFLSAGALCAYAIGLRWS